MIIVKYYFFCFDNLRVIRRILFLLAELKVIYNLKENGLEMKYKEYENRSDKYVDYRFKLIYYFYYRYLLSYDFS